MPRDPPVTSATLPSSPMDTPERAPGSSPLNSISLTLAARRRHLQLDLLRLRPLPRAQPHSPDDSHHEQEAVNGGDSKEQEFSAGPEPRRPLVDQPVGEGAVEPVRKH